ncbi:hypothetical protein B0H10DRAFT_1844462 [Mycena sp. CBHHK59/15]|nr:hypothetical protein B0H10DRAFT_1844462 [Mycena sp. CBHHK59/15]
MKNGVCSIRIIHGKATSSCPEAYQFLVSAASKSSGAKPCTNVPIHCLLCSETHWKYNIALHLADRHPSWELTASTNIAAGLSDKILISHDEECRLGVPEAARISQPEVPDGSGGPIAGQKRSANPNSPAGTPRPLRVSRTSTRRTVDASGLPSSSTLAPGDGSDWDVFIA